MIDGLGVDGLDERDVIGDAGGVREEFADPHAAFAGLAELEHRGRDGEPRLAAGHGGDALALADRIGEVLVEMLHELWFVIEQVELRRPAIQVEIDEAFGLRGEMREAGEAGVDAQGRRLRGGQCAGRCAQRGERDGAGAEAGAGEELTAVLEGEVVVEGIHGRGF